MKTKWIGILWIGLIGISAMAEETITPPTTVQVRYKTDEVVTSGAPDELIGGCAAVTLADLERVTASRLASNPVSAEFYPHRIEIEFAPHYESTFVEAGVSDVVEGKSRVKVLNLQVFVDIDYGERKAICLGAKELRDSIHAAFVRHSSMRDTDSSIQALTADIDETLKLLAVPNHTGGTQASANQPQPTRRAAIYERKQRPAGPDGVWRLSEDMTFPYFDIGEQCVIPD